MFGEWNGIVVQFGVTTVVVLALIALVYWLVRRYATGGLGRIGRGRVPRLAVVDAMAVDARRRLVLVRRDNVEHLILVGGTSDLVVEHSIQRTRRPAARPAPAVTAGAEVHPNEPPAEVGASPVVDNPPIPFPQGRAPDLHPIAPEEAPSYRPAAHQPLSHAGDRPFFPLRRASAAQPVRIESTRGLGQLREAEDEPPPAMPEADPATSQSTGDAGAYVNGHDQPPPVHAAEATAAAPNVAPFPPPPSPVNDTASKVSDLEREMARLLGEITGKRPG
jgi:flagellar protein FliO/FliZ